jgi:antitoxin (DNA-binding transcriptional repressor) of toxin-antitoxin stability system
MRVVNVKEMKARLSAYLRDVGRGDTVLITDRGKVVAQLGPVNALKEGHPGQSDAVARLVALGARPPLRGPRPGDYRRPGRAPGLTTQRIDQLLDWSRGEGE